MLLFVNIDNKYSVSLASLRPEDASWVIDRPRKKRENTIPGQDVSDLAYGTIVTNGNNLVFHL